MNSDQDRKLELEKYWEESLEVHQRIKSKNITHAVGGIWSTTNIFAIAPISSVETAHAAWGA